MNFLKKLASFSFIALLIVGMVLPSDSNHGFLAPKSLAFLNAGFFFFLYFLGLGKLNRSQIWAFIFILASCFFLGTWYAVGIDQSPLVPSGQFDQLKVFLTTLFVPLAGWCYIKEGVLTAPKIFKTIIYSNLLYSVVKVTLMALHVAGVLNVWTFMHSTGLRFMSMPIVGEISRLQTSVDIVTPFIVYFVLQSERLGLNLSRRFQWFYCIVSAASVFLSFSRFLMFAYLISLLFHGFTLRFSSQIKMGICLALICLAGFVAAGPDQVSDIIDKRFFSQDNYQSDVTRRDQIGAMMSACEKNPLIGNGLGGYTRDCIRDYNLPHAYEVQWIAFLMQFGLIGLSFILSAAGFIALRFLQPPWSRNQLGYFFLFGLWLTSGFTNPFLISLTSGIIYLIFLLAGERKKSLDVY